MNIPHRYTKHQVLRGTKADAERSDALLLIKNVSCLRLTYQIRLSTYRAFVEGKKLIIEVPKNCTIHPTLKAFQTEYLKIVRIERF